jgi:hypothetical protein
MIGIRGDHMADQKEIDRCVEHLSIAMRELRTHNHNYRQRHKGDYTHGFKDQKKANVTRWRNKLIKACGGK